MYATAADIALLITAAAGIIVALGTTAATIIQAFSQANRDRVLANKVDDVHVEVRGVHDEVRTMNGVTIAELADAGETRRVEGIPAAKRTDAEAEHIEVVPPKKKSRARR